jgi:O-antigen ligase
LYSGAIAVVLLSIFWKPILGIFYLLPLIPLQTIRYRTNDFPLGSSLVGIVLLGVAVGLWREGSPIFPKGPWKRLLILYAGFTFVSLWLGSSFLNRQAPLPGDQRFAEWQEYMIMPMLMLLTAAVAPTRRQMQWMILIMCFGILALDKSFWNAISARDFSTYSEELRQEGGSMGYAGTNGLAAFSAQAVGFLLSLAAFERNFWVRLGYYGVAVYSAFCLMYSLSRGGYVALLCCLLFLGLLKQRKLFVLLGIFAFTWTTIVPPAVEQRVEMTYNSQTGELDNSAETRLSLWENAWPVFAAHPIAGVGFNTYAYLELNRRTDGVTGFYADTHNYFLKVLVETGVIGALFLLWLLGRGIGDGLILFRRSADPLFASIGLGLASWVVASIVANLFGDRWTFLQVNGYMWVLAGMVCRAKQVEELEKTEIVLVKESKPAVLPWRRRVPLPPSLPAPRWSGGVAGRDSVVRGVPDVR